MREIRLYTKTDIVDSFADPNELARRDNIGNHNVNIWNNIWSEKKPRVGRVRPIIE
jgi:hypothetical protein